MRYPPDIRWTGRLQDALKDSYVVIEEGCNGRTTIFPDPVEEWKNGLPYLKPCLNSHKPIDIVILMLGSNDLKDIYHASAGDIADGAGVLADTIKEFTEIKQGFVPKIILVSPPHIGEGILESPFSYAFDETAIERSLAFADEFRRVAKEKSCIFFDAAEVAEPSSIDSLHLSPKAHAALSKALAELIISLEE